MNITRLNFKEAIPYVFNSISQANFVALDIQMSGIVSPNLMDPCLSDTIQTRYFKIKCKAQKFIPLQLGLCPFKIDKSKVIYSPFNFYLYPLVVSQKVSEEFAFNSESMRFLAKNNFNFNKLFYEGVPFTNAQKIKRDKEYLQSVIERQKNGYSYVLKSPDVQAFLKIKLKQVMDWLAIQRTEDISTKQLYVDIQFVVVRAYESLIYLIRKKFPSLSLKFQYLDKQKQKVSPQNFLARRYIKITKLSPQQVQIGQDLTKKQQKQDLQLVSLQMNKIWSTIKQKNIPLVVHNGFLDIMHIYHRFIDSLPSEQDTFRKNVNKQFPTIYDTKFICNNNPLIFNRFNKDTSLGNCYKILSQMESGQQQSNKQQASTKSDENKVQNCISQYCQQYSFGKQVAHEAGFDALMTAYTFVNTMKLMKWTPQLITKQGFSQSIKYFCNKIPLGNIKIPYNLQQKIQFYQKQANKQFHFSLLEWESKKAKKEHFMQRQIQISNYFSEKFGPVKIIWKDKQVQKFVLTFIRVQDQQKFYNSIERKNFSIFQLNEKQNYLISLKPTSKLQNTINS